MLNLGKKLELAIKARVPLMIWGRQGIGKTSVINQVSKKLFGSSKRKDPTCITLILSQMEATDLIGLPGKTEDGKTMYYKPVWWPKDEGGILLLDELNRADRYCINAAHQLVLEGRIGENVLPKGWVVVAACNPETDDEMGMTRLGAAFMDRFCHIDVHSSSAAWEDWAKGPGNISFEVLSFIGAQKQMLNPSDDGKKWKFDDIMTRVTPSSRSWEFVNNVLVACADESGETNTKLFQNVGFTLVKGLVGIEGANAFLKHLQDEIRKPMSFDDIMKHGVKDKRWQRALKDKDLPYMMQVLELATPLAEKALTEIFNKDKKKGPQNIANAVSEKGELANFFEIVYSCPDETAFAWMRSLKAQTVWDVVATHGSDKYMKRVADIFNNLNER